MTKPVLTIFSGLPGTGKSTLARLLAQSTGAMYVRIDTVEAALKEICQFDPVGEGYQLSYRVISDNLSLGISAIADSCNPIALTRRAWEQVALESDADFRNVQVVCTDPQVHRRRIELRKASGGAAVPDWQEVRNRHYEAWDRPVIMVDTAASTPEQSFSELRSRLVEWSLHSS